jgi:hypothetical protein
VTVIDRGVSQIDIEDTVGNRHGKGTDIVPDASEAVAEVKSKAKKISGFHKTEDITLKRVISAKPMKPDSEKPSLRKLPGKTKSPTRVLKKSRNS